MPRILFLHSSSDLYGASVILLHTLSILRRGGYSVHLLLPEQGPLVKRAEQIGVTVEVLNLAILRRKYFTIWGLFNRLYYLIKCFVLIRGIVKRQEIKLIYSNTYGVVIGALAALVLGVPHIYHIHEILAPSWLNKVLSITANRSSKKVIVVSNAVKKHVAPYIKPSVLTRIYNGLDYSPYLEGSVDIRGQLGYENHELLIGLIGRIHFWKGQDYFLEICKNLKEAGIEAKYLIVGDVFPGYEYLEDKLRQLIQQWCLEEEVNMLGFRDDIPNILRSIDVFVSSSILPDPLPTVILEAMASAKPVVATNHGGAMEMVVHGKTGLLIPHNDAISAAGEMMPLLRDENRREVMGREGRQRALEEFSIDSYKLKITRLIEEIL